MWQAVTAAAAVRRPLQRTLAQASSYNGVGGRVYVPLRAQQAIARGIVTRCVPQGQSGDQQQSEHERPKEGRGSRRNPSPGRHFFTMLTWLPVPMYLLMVGVSVGSIRGPSMSPTLNPLQGDKDLVLLNRSAARTFSYDVGDVVMLISPLDPNLLICKRILAMPGDVVSINASREGIEGSKKRRQRRYIRIPPSHVWVEGDRSTLDADRPNDVGCALTRTSRDSREYGPIPMGLITDRIDLILWPPSRAGRIPSRPGFDETGALNARRARQRKARIEEPSQHTAHPDDSFMSPYLVDWEWTTDQSAKQGLVVPPTHARGQGNASSDPEADARLARRQKREGQREETLKQQLKYWNSLSRGGRLGDDAEIAEGGRR